MEKKLKKKKNNLPALAKQGRGFDEETPREDYIMPRAKLLQALSPEVQDDGMGQGLLINSLSKEILPTEFIPIFKFTNWIRWNSRNKEDPNFDATFEPGALMYESKDPNDPKVIADGKFGPNGEKPIATKYINFFSYFPGHEMPIIISFAKTSIKAGRKLLTLARFKGGDMFSKKYVLTSKKVENEIGKFFVLNVELASKAVAEADFKIAETWYTSFRDKPVEAHHEGEEKE